MVMRGAVSPHKVRVLPGPVSCKKAHQQVWFTAKTIVVPRWNISSEEVLKPTRTLGRQIPDDSETSTTMPNPW